MKACHGKGHALFSWESGHAVPFPPQDSVVHVYLSIATTTQDPAGWDPRHLTNKKISSGVYVQPSTSVSAIVLPLPP